ncbi:MAG: nitroreductase [Deltaproteobacteria bacterium]|uniref:Nitroreductase n=1 Tax=Candidatus Desulfacyla euxinica TaxID=2841693 RepID=A0A8J6T9X6_9DELT|nr:nitroreductase [Candidatus Desulfacyla euxinica]MBL7216095.1 nitroreductase [Desulfobacteraceae bacterium]
MDVKEAVLARRSIRAFNPEPVPREVLEEIMENALWAPSWGNTQPWKLTLIGGETLEKIKEEYVQMFGKGIPANPDFSMPTEFNVIQKARYQGLGKGLFLALGIAREDKEKRNAYYEEMMRCLGAPHLICLHLDREFHPYTLMDVGIILQTIALLAVEQGLGTCILAQAIRYPGVVRKHSDIPDDQMLVMGMAIGRPIMDHPVNIFRSERGKPEEFLNYVDVG